MLHHQQQQALLLGPHSRHSMSVASSSSTRLLQQHYHHGRHRVATTTTGVAAAVVCAQEPAAAASSGGGGGAAAANTHNNSTHSSHHHQQPFSQHPPLHNSDEGCASTAPAMLTCPEAQLSRSMQAAQSWPQLTSVLLEYGQQQQRHTSLNSRRLAPPPQLQQRSKPSRHQQQRGYGQQHQQQAQQQQEQEEQALRLTLPQLNSRHLARLLKTLVRLQPPLQQHASTPTAAAGGGSNNSWASRREQQLFWSFTQLAFSECMQQLPSLSAWELSSTLWAASKLGAHAPPALLLRRLLQQLTEPSILAAASAQDISMSLYAVASLAVQVPEQQLESLLGAAAQHMQDASPQALCNTLWAVATLQHRPQEQWLQQLEARCTSLMQQQASSQQQQQQPYHYYQQQQQQLFTPHGLYQLIWAMAKLQWHPTAAFTAAFWGSSLSQSPRMMPQGTSGVLWAVANLGSMQPPPQQWTAAWLAALQQQMLQQQQQQQDDGRCCCRAQDYGNALWAVVRLGLKPSEEWLQTALSGSEGVLRTAGTQELSNMLWSFAKLGVRPGAKWMHSWLAAMQARMDSYCAPALASSAYALALLRFRPPRSWVQTLLFQTQRQMPAFGAQELSNLLWALAVLGVRPGAAWLREFEQQALHEAGSFNAQELSIIFWSAAKLQHTPPAHWVARLLREGLEVAGGLQAQSLVLLLGSLCRWHLPQMHKGGHYRVLLPRYWAAAEQLLPQCNLSYLSTLYAARVKLGVLPSKQWGRSFWGAVSKQLGKAVAGGAAALSSAPASQQLAAPAGGGGLDRGAAADNLGSVKMHRSVAAGTATVSSLQPAAISQLVWSAGKLWRAAPVPWQCLQLLLAAAAVVLPQCNAEGLSAVGIGLRQMLQAHRQRARPYGLTQVGRRAGSRSSTSRLRRYRPSGVRLRRLGRAGATAGAGSAPAATRYVRYQQLQQLTRPLWQAWFARGTQLMLRQLPSSSTHISCRELSLQLRVVASLKLRPPADWLDAMQSAVHSQLSSCSAEELSWLVLDLVKLHVAAASAAQPAHAAGNRNSSSLSTTGFSSRDTPLLLLPQGFVQAVLCRAGVLHDSSGLNPHQMRRLQAAFRQLMQLHQQEQEERGLVLSEGEVHQWQRLLYVWKVSQGMG